MAEMTTTSPTTAPKAQIDRFELIEQLTRGTLGTVHKANDTKTSRIVALRFFDLPEWIEDPNGRLQRILTEARNASSLNHANITRLVGGGHKELKIYLASEFIEGPTLRELMVSKQLVLDDILNLAKQLLGALDYSFENGVLHQALNPANLKVLTGGTLKVMDFGVMHDRNIIAPSPTKKIENAHYWSPEQVKNRPLERASNLFTAATILYELYTTRNPFAGKHTGEIERNITEVEPFPASKAHPRVPEGISRVLGKALSKNPLERFASGHEFYSALETAKSAPMPVSIPAVPLPVAERTSTSGVNRPAAVPVNGTGTSGVAAVAPAKAPVPVASRSGRISSASPAKSPVPAFSNLNINWNYAAVGVLVLVALFMIGISVSASKHRVASLAVSQSVPLSQAQAPAEQPVASTPPASNSTLQVLDVSEEEHAVKQPRPAAVARPAAPAGPALGALTITSYPDGAQVQLDNAVMGVTPQNIDSISPGVHNVTVSKAGYASETRSVTVAARNRANLAVRLSQIRGTLTITGSPLGATVVLDGRNTGKVTPAEFVLDPGQHSLTLRKNGYLDNSSEFTVRTGDTLSYAPALKQLGRTDTIRLVGNGGIKKIFGGIGGNGSSAGMARVQIKTRPKGARITINSMVVERPTPVELEMDPGVYNIVLEMLGYKPLHKTITVGADQKLQIDEDLQN
jgi:serine/threonine protein kinase